MAVGSKDSEEDNEKPVKKWNGSTIELDDFDKKIARWLPQAIWYYHWRLPVGELDA